jgi:hypothetical protein
MGWLYGWHSRAALVAELRRQDRFRAGCTVLRSRVIGARHWYLIEGPDKVRMVGLDLLGVSGGQHGYKDMDESCGPLFYDCPVQWLDLCSEPINEYSRVWRERVRRYAARPRPTVGAVLEYCGIQYRLAASLGRRGWEAVRVSDGMVFRLKARQANDSRVVAA